MAKKPTKGGWFLSERKLNKLRRDPRLFFVDAVKKRSNAATELAIRAATHLPVHGFVSCKRRYTVISAVYNVERYLDRFLGSLTSQTVSFDDHIELILVDDGSTDGSAALIERWQKKHPAAIRYVEKENGGQASARNVGLAHMSGEWVTFIDPDDFVHPRYFERVEKFLDENAELDLAMLCCKRVFYYENGDRYADTYPLNYVFKDGSFATLQEASRDFIPQSAATSFLRTDLLAAQRLYFDETLKPNFEDLHFCGHYLLHALDKPVGFVADAIYYYRKREDGTSTLDLGWEQPSRFDVVLEKGYVDLLETAARRGTVPQATQRLVLYDLFWYLKKIVDNENSVAFLTTAQRERFVGLVERAFRYIEPNTIATFNLPGAWFYHKVGMLGRFKGEDPASQILYVYDYDRTKNLVLLVYFYWGEPRAERFLLDGKDVTPTFAKVQVHEFLGSTFVNERRVWLELGPGYSTLEVEIDGAPAKVSSADGVLTRSGVERMAPRRRVEPAVETHVLRRMAERPSNRARFRDAWLLIDRDVQADDNAEHLYRWIKDNRPDINAYFVLTKDSHDWHRLERDGFRLIAFGSMDHKLLLLNAAHVISSHADSFVLRVLKPELYGDALSYKFTFLQHGVTHNDMSHWLNAKTIDLFVTTSPQEHRAIAGDGRYKFSDKEVKQVGFARHDALLARPEPTEDVILVMPTWRQYLVAVPKPGTTERGESPRFYESSYAKAWKSFLHSPRLREIVERHGYRLRFFPHANVQRYLSWFDAPDWIEMLTHKTAPDIQKLFREARFLVTDFSSVFFEMGILDKPTLYYQFDYDEMYGGNHPARTGYFRFERDGFGPVFRREDELMDAIERRLASGGMPTDAELEKMRATLPMRDGNNRRRTVEAIEALDSPLTADAPRDALARAQARTAAARSVWPVAAAIYDRLAERVTLSTQERLDRARARRAVGDLEGARAEIAALEAALATDEIRADLRPMVRVEAAELLALEGQRDEALRRLAELADTEPAFAVPLRVRLAQLHREHGELEAAGRALEGLPSREDVERERAELAEASGHAYEAAERRSDMAARYGKIDDALRAARAFERAGDLRRALDEVGRVAHRDRRAEALRLRLAAASGAPIAEVKEGILRLCRELDDDAPGDVRRSVVGVLTHLRLFDEAEATLSAGGGDPQTRLARWELWASANRWNDIVGADRAWLDDAPPDTRAEAVLVLARGLGHVQRAADGLKELARLDHDGHGAGPVLLARGELLHALERWSEAIEVWERHLREHPDVSAQWVRARLALAYERAGRPDDATRVLLVSARANALERLLADPDDADAYRQLLATR
ncbi:MAG: CDP-glycerol glycerophosphotransferase family protein [Sandaracinaceae bacterium]